MATLVNIFSDTHFSDTNISSIKNFVKDGEELFEKQFIERLKYQKTSTNCPIIAMHCGDLAHKGFKDIGKYTEWLFRFEELHEYILRFFMTVGNHEITYNKNNIINTFCSEHWYMPNEQAILDKVKFCGKKPLITVASFIDIADVRFHFIHYDTSFILKKEGSKNIGLTHNSVLSPKIIKSLQGENEIDLATRYIGYENLDSFGEYYKLDELFVGHMHCALGDYTIETPDGHLLNIHYLGSLTRTNAVELAMKNRVRRLPIICIEDGEYKIEYDYIELKSYEELADFNTILTNKEAYRAKKDRNVFKGYKLAPEEDPIFLLKQKYKDDPRASMMIEKGLQGEMPEFLSHEFVGI